MSQITRLARDLGLPIVDADEPLLLNVRPADVTGASSKDPRRCAFAKACKRMYRGVQQAYFYRGTAWLQYADRMVRYLLPDSVQREIVSFDRAGIIAAGSYRLVPAPPSDRLGMGSERSRRSRVSPERRAALKAGGRRRVQRVAGIRSAGL